MVTTGTSAESKSLTAPDTCTSQTEVLSDYVSVDRADRLEIIQGANIAVGITTSSNEGEALCSSSLEHPTLSSPQGDSVPSTSNHLTGTSAAVPYQYDIAEVLYGKCAPTDVGEWSKCEESLKKLTEHDKYLVLKHHVRPTTDDAFPVIVQSGRHRKCSPSMLSNNFVFSPSTNSIFCLPCSLFIPLHATKRGMKDRSQLSSFVNIGCSNYKKMYEKEAIHSQSEYHQDACFVAEGIKHRFEQPETTISFQVNSDLQNRQKLYKHILTRIAQVIHFCGKQGIALRGHNEDTNDSHHNPGNFLAILQLLSKNDPELEGHLTKPLMKNCTYIRQRSQNEMIEVIGKQIIQKDIINEIRSSGMHSILCDEVSSSNDEILSLCIRFVDSKKQIREEFVDFIEMDRITGEALYEAISNFYQNHSLSLQELHGQCYDGASNMSGVRKGLSGRILEQSKKAFYTHCTSHALNLCIAATCKEQNIQTILSQMTALSIFFKYSPKREKLLEYVVEKETHSCPQRKVVIGLCKTRWAERDIAFEHFYLAYPFIVKALEIINGTCQGIEAYPDDIKVGWETEARRDATAHLNALCNFGILIGVVALYRLLHPLAMITKCLQGKAVDIVKAFRDIQEVKHDFQCLRDGVDMEFQAIYNQAERLGQSVGVEPSLPRIAKMQMYR